MKPCPSLACEHGRMSMTNLDPPLPSIRLTDGVITLRPFEHDDLPAVEEAAADDFIPKIATVPASFTVEAGRQFIERQHHRLTTGTGWSLAIADAGTDVAVGQAGLWVANAAKGRAEIGYWVVPSGRGRGAAARAVRLLTEWAFANLDIHRLSLFIEPWNEASIATALHAGFEQEGLLRSWERVDGAPVDVLSFVLLRS